MTNIEQFTRELMLAHDIDYETAQYRAFTFYENLAQDVPSVLNDWISIDDILPEKNTYVAGWDGEHVFVEILPFYRRTTHWQPLPKPPKGK